MNTKLKSCLVIAAAVVTFATPTETKADAVTDWNARATTYASTGGRPGPTWVLDVAIVQAAVYDAVQAIEGDYQPYCGAISGASGSPTAAAATAARDVLVYRFPLQAGAIIADYNAYVSGIDPSDPGFGVGHIAAQCMIAQRANDGSFPIGWPPFFGGTGIGEWRPAASGPWTFSWLPDVRPFSIRSAEQFRAGPPPDLDSPEYTRAYNEVKRLGGNGTTTPSDRTPQETDMANFWNGNFPAQMNALARNLAIAHALSISESSRLLALVDVSVADAGIVAWDNKRFYNFWRPQTAIRLGNDDGNAKTLGDANWTPFVGTPPYSDYTSGANAFTASATRAMSLYFGTNEMDFQIATTNPGPTVVDIRSYSKFSEVRDEVEYVRILEGIHFRFADAIARRQGEHIAQWVNAHDFRPVEE